MKQVQLYAYAETLEDALDTARARERAAIERAIELLRQADQAGPGSRELADALVYVHRLWSILIEDLANSENRLPQKLRADLISVGLWSLRELDDISNGRSQDLSQLVEVLTLIGEGLR